METGQEKGKEEDSFFAGTDRERSLQVFIHIFFRRASELLENVDSGHRNLFAQTVLPTPWFLAY
jgi:hypothetical protein